ncbi:RHS repeat-associated core domain-containing protein [Acanthopleuribacter pedis]
MQRTLFLQTCILALNVLSLFPLHAYQETVVTRVAARELPTQREEIEPLSSDADQIGLRTGIPYTHINEFTGKLNITLEAVGVPGLSLTPIYKTPEEPYCRNSSDFQLCQLSGTPDSHNLGLGWSFNLGYIVARNRVISSAFADWERVRFVDSAGNAAVFGRDALFQKGPFDGGARDACDTFGCLPEQADVHFIDRSLRRITRRWRDDGTLLQGFSQNNYFLKEPNGQVTEFLAQRRVTDEANRSAVRFYPIRITQPNGRFLTVTYVGGLDADGTVPEPARIASLVDQDGRRLVIDYHGPESAYQGLPEKVELRYGSQTKLMARFGYQILVAGTRRTQSLHTVTTAEGRTFTVTTGLEGRDKPVVTELQLPGGGVIAFNWFVQSFKYVHADDGDCRPRRADDDCIELETRERDYLRLSSVSHGQSWLALSYRQGSPDEEWEFDGRGFIEVTVFEEMMETFNERTTRYINTPIHHTLYQTFEFDYLVGLPAIQRTLFGSEIARESWDYTPVLSIGGHAGGDAVRIHAVKKHGRLIDNVWLDRHYTYAWYGADTGLDASRIHEGYLAPLRIREQARDSTYYREQVFEYKHRVVSEFAGTDDTRFDAYALSLPSFQEERGLTRDGASTITRTIIKYEDSRVPLPTTKIYHRNATETEVETLSYHPSGRDRGYLATRTFGSVSTIHTQDYQFGVPRYEVQPESTPIIRYLNFDGTLASETKNGITTEYRYDGDQRLTRILRPGRPDEVTRYRDDYLGSSRFWEFTEGVANSDVIQFDFPSPVVGIGSSTPTVPIETITLDSMGRVSKQLQGVWSYADYETTTHYDAFGRVAYETDSRARGIAYRYDVVGRVVKKWLFPLGGDVGLDQAPTSEFGYSRTPDGNLITVETARAHCDEPAKIKRVEHDILGRLVRASTNGHETAFTHTAHALGTETVTTPYDNPAYARRQVISWLGQLMEERHPEMDETMGYAYDGRGLRVHQFAGDLPQPAWEMWNSYDGLGRLVLQEGRNHLELGQDVRRPIKQFEYDGLNRLIRATAFNDDGYAAPVVTRYRDFNEQHQPRVIDIQLPRLEQGALGENGRLTRDVSGSRTYQIRQAYDHLGRVREVQHPNGGVAARNHSFHHKELQVFYGRGPEHPAGPDFHQVVRATHFWTPDAAPWWRKLDGGRCQSNDCLPTYPSLAGDDPTLQGLIEDVVARVAQTPISPEATRSGTNATDAPEHQALADYLVQETGTHRALSAAKTVTQLNTFDAAHRAVGSRISAAGEPLAFVAINNIRYNEFGTITGYDRRDALFSDGIHIGHGYDALGRLARFSLGAQTNTYGYDEAGNFLTRSGLDLSVGKTRFHLPAFETSVAGRNPYQVGSDNDYDRLGRLSVSEGKHYRYQRNGRLDGVFVDSKRYPGFLNSSVEAKHFYDAFGQRVVSIRPNENRTTYSIRDQNHTVITEEEVAANGLSDGNAMVARRQFVTHQGQAVFVETQQFIAGGLASTRYQYRLTDRTGNPILSWEPQAAPNARQQFYSPYGVQMVMGNAFKGPHGFTGHEEDPDGLIYMRARYYNPGAGCFTQPDPGRDFDATIPTSYNLYAYARSNPMAGYDPSGEVVETLWDVANIGMGVVSAVDNISQGNWGAAAIDAGGVALDIGATLIPGVPGGAGTAIKAAGGASEAGAMLAKHGTEMMAMASAAATRLKDNYKKGMAFQNSIGLPKNNQSFEVIGGRVNSRKPDFLDLEAGSIGEAKGGKYLYLSSQIKDYLAFAKEKALIFTLYVKDHTKLSAPLKALVEAGEIVLERVK